MVAKQSVACDQLTCFLSFSLKYDLFVTFDSASVSCRMIGGFWSLLCWEIVVLPVGNSTVCQRAG
jgi:hypothetical protein